MGLKSTLAITLLAFTGLTVPLNAQVASRISGTVIDQSGAAVPNATVDLLLPGGQRAVFTTTTSGEGLYSITGVPSGTYTVSVTSQGFKKHNEQGVTLTPGKETSLPPIKLEIGGAAEVIEVKD